MLREVGLELGELFGQIEPDDGPIAVEIELIWRTYVSGATPRRVRRMAVTWWF
jgi:hypothetical protein